MTDGLRPDLLDAIRNSPAAVPPDGVVIQFIDPSNGNRVAVGIIILSITLPVLASLIRFYTKVFGTRRPFFLAGTWVLRDISQGPGLFVHQWNLKVKDLEVFLYSYLLSTTLYCVALLLVKAAILLELTHIFVARPMRNVFYWICYGMIVSNTMLYTATILTITFACTPRERIWRQYLPGTCINFNVFNIFITAFHLIFDVLTLLLPQTVIWKLALTKRQKIGLSVVFSVATLACFWAAGRVASAVRLTQTQDLSFAYSQYVLWGLGEVATAEIVFCVPAFPFLFRQESPPRRLCSLLKSRIKARHASKETSTNSALSQSPLNPIPIRPALPTYSRVWCDNDSIAELGTARVHTSCSSDCRRDHLKPKPKEILITTQVDVSIHREPSVKR
ncbi:hypothetical protein F4802DRAFT_610988 [Xylaria palmicola]|nr:hypothetical protein F4802DRAFT_610988 [Xylaria palmicola]